MMYKEFEILPVTEEYLDKCEELVATPETIAFNGEFVTKDWLFELSEDNLSFVMIVDGKTVGCIFGEKLLKSHGCLLHLLCIDVNFRNMGLGTKLIKHFEEQCKNTGVEWILLYSTYQSTVNHIFYTNLGYINKSGMFYEFGKELK